MMKVTHKNWLNMRVTGVTYICDTGLKWVKSHSSNSKFRVAASIVLKKINCNFKINRNFLLC